MESRRGSVFVGPQPSYLSVQVVSRDRTSAAEPSTYQAASRSPIEAEPETPPTKAYAASQLPALCVHAAAEAKRWRDRGVLSLTNRSVRQANALAEPLTGGGLLRIVRA